MSKLEHSDNIQKCKKYIRKSELTGVKTFEFEIDEENNDVKLIKYYETNLDYDVIEIPSFVTSAEECLFDGVNQSLKVIHKDNQIKIMKNMFTSFNGEILDLSEFDTTGVEDMCEMFEMSHRLKELKLSKDKFDTSKVKYMNAMFNNCKSLTSLDVSMFDTSNVEDMMMLFLGCHKLKELDLSNFDTSKVEIMIRMFTKCKSLTELDLSNFDTSKVVDMYGTFDGCKNLRSLNITSFDVSKVTDMAYLFSGCSSLKEIDLTSFVCNNEECCYKNMFEDFDISDVNIKTSDERLDKIIEDIRNNRHR